MTAAPADCLWCYGTNYVHTSGGKLGDTICGPAICGHNGRWRVVDESERAEHVAAVERLRAHARRQENTIADSEPVEAIDITEPRHRHPADRDDDQFALTPERNQR